MDFNEVFKSLTSILIDDCCKSHEELEKKDTQFKRRSYVKAFFTMIEGQVSLMNDLHLISQASIWWIDIFLELEVPYWPD